MSQTREVITLQIGHYSNFIGTHWWNTQESSFAYDSESISQPVDHDVLFREGVNFRRETTYTPRLIAVDLNGSLRTLRPGGTLYEVPLQKSSRCQWIGKVDVHKAHTPKKNEFLEDLEKQDLMLYPELKQDSAFDEDKDICIESSSSGPSLDSGQSILPPKEYDLDDSVSVWSDFLRTQLHPRSIFLLPEYSHYDYQDPFDLFGSGMQAYANDHNQEDIEEKIRQFAEECDLLQGFNIILDGYDGFAGLAAGIQQHLKDEYANKVQFSFPVYRPTYKIHRPTQGRTEEVHRLYTTLFCLDALAQHSSIFTPLNLGCGLVSPNQSTVSFPHLKYKSNLAYHTSAILSAFVETITLPYRRKKNSTSLVEMSKELVCVGRKLLASRICFPLAIPVDGYLASALDSQSLRILPRPLTPFCEFVGEHSAVMQSFVFSGIDNERIYGPHYQSSQKVPVEELLGRHLNLSSPSSISTVTVLQPSFKAVTPYPNIFSEEVQSFGCNKSKTGEKAFSVVAGLRNTDSVAHLLQEVTQASAKINFRKFHRCLETGLEMDDITETIDSLTCFTYNYVDPNRTDDSPF